MDKEEIIKIRKNLDNEIGDKDSQLLEELIGGIRKIHLIIPTPKEREEELHKLYEKIAQITERKANELAEVIAKKETKLELPEKLKVEVENQPEFPKEIKVSNLPTPTKFPDEIKLKKPDWYKQANQQDIIDSLEDLIKAVKENKKPNLETYREPGRALAVRLVNRKGSDFYEAVMAAMGSFGAGSFPFENASKTAKAALVDKDGHIQVDILTGGGGLPNDVDSGNSTTSTLNGGAVFTGAGVDLLEYHLVTITLDSSHDSATDGISFQFSTDNTNWDDVYLFTYTAANGARRFQFPVTSQYFRVVYTNGGTNQTHFRLQTILHPGNTLTTIHRLVDDTNNDRSATLVKAAIMGQKAGGGPGAGDFIAVQLTAAGNFKTSVQEISDGLDVGAGNAGAETQRVILATDQPAVPTTEAAPSTLVAFVTNIPTAGARVQLDTNTIIAGVLEAPSTNAGNVFIGGSNVSSAVFGSELQPGQSIGVAINNSDKIWIDAATSGDDVAFFGS